MKTVRYSFSSCPVESRPQDGPGAQNVSNSSSSGLGPKRYPVFFPRAWGQKRIQCLFLRPGALNVSSVFSSGLGPKCFFLGPGVQNVSSVSSSGRVNHTATRNWKFAAVCRSATHSALHRAHNVARKRITFRP